MKQIKTIIISLSILCLYNCTRIEIVPVASSDQVIDHNGVITSQYKNSVSVSYYKNIHKLGHLTLFLIIVENYGDKPLNFSNDNITVIFNGNNKEWASKKINLLGVSEVLFERVWEESKTHQQYWDEDSIIITGRHPSGDVKAPYSERTEYVTNERIEHMKNSIPRIMPINQNIMPYHSASGVIVCETTDMKDNLEGNFLITVLIDDEKHNFTFTRKLE